jgi:hypothetical protein
MSTSTQLTRVRQRLDDLNLAASTFAKACGISAATLSTVMSGGTNLSGPLEARLAENSVALVELSDAIAPLALPKHADGLRLLLEHVKKNPDSIAELRTAISKVFGTNGSTL